MTMVSGHDGERGLHR